MKLKLRIYKGTFPVFFTAKFDSFVIFFTEKKRILKTVSENLSFQARLLVKITRSNHFLESGMKSNVSAEKK